MVLLCLWIWILYPAFIFLITEFDFATREGKVLSVSQISPLDLFEFVFGSGHAEFIWFYGDIQCAVEDVVKVQSQLLKIRLLLFDASVIRIGFGWTRCHAISFFDPTFQRDPLNLRQFDFSFLSSKKKIIA